MRPQDQDAKLLDYAMLMRYAVRDLSILHCRMPECLEKVGSLGGASECVVGPGVCRSSYAYESGHT